PFDRKRGTRLCACNFNNGTMVNRALSRVKNSWLVEAARNDSPSQRGRRADQVGKCTNAMGDKKILYLIYGNPAAFPPLLNSSQILAECGWQVRLLGVHSMGAESLEFPSHPLIRCTVLPKTRPGWKQKTSYLAFVARSWRLIREWRPDWIYVSDYLAAPAGMWPQGR